MKHYDIIIPNRNIRIDSFIDSLSNGYQYSFSQAMRLMNSRILIRQEKMIYNAEINATLSAEVAENLNRWRLFQDMDNDTLGDYDDMMLVRVYLISI